jgi:ABC-type transporter Mla subunit MlaD
MRNRSGITGVASSPVIVGAVTVLVVIVAVFLAYNANQGLPFVSTYDLKARVPNANALVDYNEVRIGGSRVGVVEKVRPIQLENGAVAAELDLSLDQSANPIPADSTMIIRPKSPLGLKYLQIVPGDSPRGLEAGETIPLSAARPEPVDIDEFFSMFDAETRRNVQRVNAGFGSALAGRGPQVNSFFGTLSRLTEVAQPALRTIVAPGTNFAGFWRALEDLNATVAPVALTQAEMFVALDRTFAAFARVSRPYIQETISKGPRTLDEATADLPAIRPFFNSSGRFFTALGPGAKALGRTSPTIDAALRAGIPALNRTPRFFAQLDPTAEALLDFQSQDGVFNGLDLLVDLNQTLGPPLRFLAPAQTKCNYLTLAFANLAEAFSEATDEGSWLSAVAFELPDGPNAESGPASAPASGPGNKNYLHYNPYPRTAAPGQDGVCEAGNERYQRGRTTIGRSPELWGTTTTNDGREG